MEGLNGAVTSFDSYNIGAQGHQLRHENDLHHCSNFIDMRFTDEVGQASHQDASTQHTASTNTLIQSQPCMLSEYCVNHKDEIRSVSSMQSSDYTPEVMDESDSVSDPFEKLPDHLLIEVLVRLPVSCWISAACVRQRWADLFRGDVLWQTALTKRWPGAGRERRWPGPIGRGSNKRRYISLHVSKSLFSFEDQDGDVHELAGHVYLFLKEQLEVSSMPLSFGLLHGIIIDQFLACGKAGSIAHDLASRIWLAVIDNLDENEHTFHLLMQIAEEWEVFLPYPFSKFHAVQWRLFERLFTDFRDCLSQFDYYNVLTRAKHKFEFIPSAWLGY